MVNITKFVESIEPDLTSDAILKAFFRQLKEVDTGLQNNAINLLSKKLENYGKQDLRKLLANCDEEADKKIQYLLVEEVKKRFKLLSLEESRQIMVFDTNHYNFTLTDLERFLSSRIEYYNVDLQYHLKEVYTWIQNNLQFPMRKLNFNPYIIPFRNGYCNIQTSEFITNDYIKANGEEWHFFYSIPHDFKIDKDYDCPKFRKTLIKWIDEKTTKGYRKGHRTILINDIFEMIGLCMSLEVGFKTAFISYGEKDSGKSQLSNIVEYIIGSENMSHQELKMLTERFGSLSIQFRLLNLCPDMSNATIKNTGVFNLYTGADTSIPGEVKNGKTFSFPPTAKFWFNINLFPYVKEDNNAFFERFALVFFPNRFDPNNENFKINYFEEIIKDPNEVQGIMHEALEGLIRLYKRKGFRKEIKENTKHVWSYKSNVYYRFVYDYCEDTDMGGIEVKEFLERLIEETGAGPTVNSTTRALQAMGYLRKERKPQGKSEYYYAGLKWKEGFEIQKEINIDKLITDTKDKIQGIEKFYDQKDIPLTKIILENIQNYIYEIMKPKENSDIQPTESSLTLRDMIKKKTNYNNILIEKAFKRLIESGLLVEDYQDQVYYDHKLHEKLKILKEGSKDET